MIAIHQGKRSNKIAFLVPTFNAGALLHDTVASAAKAELPADSYEYVVCDNASDDDSVDRLPSADRRGAPTTVIRNEKNIGRVQNWNRALEAAEELGFGHVMFLMAGDTLKDAGVLELRSRMIASGAALGLASYEVVNEQLQPLRLARRINWRGDRAIEPRRFLQQSFGRGAMLCAPLGANLYRLHNAAPLRFDSDDASHTDQRATAQYAMQLGNPIVYLDRPVSRWRQRSGRFHGSMTVEARFRSDLRVIEDTCREAGIEPDYPKIHATMMLRSCFHRGGWRPQSDWSRANISWIWLARLVFRIMRYHTPWLIEP